jgi:hypothetical protein
MPFGELFTGTFGQIWRHKRLWLFGLLGLALTSIGLMVYQVFQYRWQSGWLTTMGDLMKNPGMMPERYFNTMMSSMVWLWVGMGIWVIVGLFGYIVNLVMRGATMSEAAFAWGGGRTKTGRGVSAGAGRAAYVFMLDLLWVLPGLLLACGGIGAFAMVIAAAATASDGDKAATGALILTIITALCCIFCLVLLVGLLSMVFAPLMYQSAVAGRRGLGAAIREGWGMAKANLGAMIIFAILLWVLNIALGMLVSLLTFPFMLPWMSSWMQNFSGMMESASRGMPLDMPQFENMGWLFAATLISALLTWLTASFMQSFRLTLYAGVYRHLGGRSEAVEPEALPSTDNAAPAPLLAAAPREVEAGDASPVELAEITVPAEAIEPAAPPVEVTMPHV